MLKSFIIINDLPRLKNKIKLIMTNLIIITARKNSKRLKQKYFKDRKKI